MPYKGTPRKWGTEEQDAFQRLKDALCTVELLAHFDPSQEIGISCDTSNVEVAWSSSFAPLRTSTCQCFQDADSLPAVLHSQIQKEAPAVIFALKKLHIDLHDGHFYCMSQCDYTTEYRTTTDHGNNDTLGRLPASTDVSFDREEEQAGASTVCLVKQVSLQLDPVNPKLLAKESSKNPVIFSVMRYVEESWPQALDSDEVKCYRKLNDSLSTESGCLFHGVGIVIARSLRRKGPGPVTFRTLRNATDETAATNGSLIYTGHTSMMISRLGRIYTACAEHQSRIPIPANHPWMLPEKPWGRLHLDHAVNFLGTNVMVGTGGRLYCKPL